MTNYFTPEDAQDIPKSTSLKQKALKIENQPSHMTMKIVFGYAAALSVIKTKSLGKMKVLLN